MQTAKKTKNLFKSADFESSECLVVIRNVTTSTDLPKGKKAVLTALEKGGLTLLLPLNTCSTGHCLLLRFFEQKEFDRVKNSPRSVQDKAAKLSVTTKVVRVSPSDNDHCLVDLDLQQYVEKEWQGFVKTFTVIQAQVSGLMKKIKE